MVRTYDPNGYRINSRRAEEINDAQAAQHQQAVAENQAAGKVLERQAAPVVSGATQAAQENVNLQSVGGIEANREARLDKANATDAQRAENESNLQGIMNPGFGETRGMGVAGFVPSAQIHGETKTQYDTRIAAEHSRYNEQLKTDQIKQQNEQNKADRSASSSAAASEATDQSQQSMTPQENGMQAAFTNLPPEFQFLGPIFQQMMGTFQQAEQGQQALYGEQMKSVQQTFGTIDQKLAAMGQNQADTATHVQGVLDKVREQQEKYLTQQETAVNERLEWTRAKEVRRIHKERQQAVDSKIAEMALKNRAGSDGAVAEMEEADEFYSQALADLETEAGIQRTELAAKFSGLYAQVQTDYYTQSVGNIKEFNAAMERISFQDIANTQARATAEQEAMNTLITNTTNLRKEKAVQLLDIGTQIAGYIFQGRVQQQQESRWQYEQQWQQYAFNTQQQRLEEQFSLQMEDRQFAREEQSDTREFAKSQQKVQQIRSGIEQNKVMLPYRKDIQPLFENAKTAYLAGDNAFSDRALAKIYEKMIEPGSVVMPGEYSDIAASAPLWSKLTGKYKKVLEGGQAWTDKERTELYDLVTKFHATYKARHDEAAQQFYTDIDWHNSNVSPANRITYGQVGLPEYTTSNKRNMLEERAEPGLFPTFDAGGGEPDTVGSQALSLGRMTQGYATPIDESLYSSNTVAAWGGKHKGLDIAMPQNTRIPAFAEGEVVEVGYESGWGGTVVIKDQNGALHRYSHLSQIAPYVEKGARVGRGQVLALSGGKKGTKGAGNSTGPHLDYRVQVKGQYVDPMTYHG